jgi:hypothetical protein
MSDSTHPSDPRLRRVVAGLEAVPPAVLGSRPWERSGPIEAVPPAVLGSRPWERSGPIEAVPPAVLGSRPWERSGPTDRRRPGSASRRRAGLALVAAGLSCAGLVASGLASTSSPPRLSAATRAEYSVFAGLGVRPSAAASTGAAREFAMLPGGIDPASLRVAQANPAFELIVAGGTRAVCLYAREPGLAGGRLFAAGGGCGPATDDPNGARLSCGYIEAPPSRGRRFLFDCLVPDAVTRVRVDTRGGTVPLAVVGNTAGAVIDQPTQLTWTAPDGGSRSEWIIH